MSGVWHCLHLTFLGCSISQKDWLPTAVPARRQSWASHRQAAIPGAFTDLQEGLVCHLPRLLAEGQAGLACLGIPWSQLDPHLDALILPAAVEQCISIICANARASDMRRVTVAVTYCSISPTASGSMLFTGASTSAGHTTATEQAS